ncbi:hypothetical protein [Vibrio hangzhouensis]|nr:hypothetical protein [Vibrio hangzhouensis]
MSILAVIGLVQFFFHESLPNAFVELPVIKSELAITNNSREIEDIILFSMNGLYNNPIVYGSTLLFPLTISLFNIFNERKLSDMCIFFLSLISILLLVSRVNIASAVFLVLFICVLKLSFKNALYTSILFSVACVILFVILKDSPVVNLIIDRFTGNDEWASVSNEEHYSDYIKSLSYISDNMILGIKINDYVTKDIITDGSWFIFALDLSPVICIILIFMFLSIAYKFWLVSRENAIPNFAPLYFILTMGGLFNSFLIDKASLSIILIFYSLQYNIALKR